MALVLIGFISVMNENAAYAATDSDISITKKGGFISATSNGSQEPISFKCGSDQSKVCWKKTSSGTIIGDPIKIWVNTGNTDLGTDNGIGYINATFEGYDVPNNPESNIRISINQTTLIFTNYEEWLNYEGSIEP